MNKYNKNILKLIKIFLSLVFYYLGLVAIIRFLFGQKGIRILAYHKIETNEFDDLNMSIPVSDFEVQIKYLSEHYHVVSLLDYLRSIQTRKKIKKNMVIITFDDGYKDNYTNAFSIVKKYSIPITIFLTVIPISTGQSLWYEVIVHLIKNSMIKELDLSNYGMGQIILKSSSDKQVAIYQIVNKAKTMPENQRQNLIDCLRRKLIIEDNNNQNNDDMENLMLSWDEIREMKNHGVTFGSHTMSHPILTQIPFETAEMEIKKSKYIIEKELGEKISLFTYPNGGPEDFNEDIINIIRKSGFSCACSLIPGVVKTGDNLFTLNRIGVDKDFIGKKKFITKALFATEMAGIFDIIFMRFL